MEISTYCIVIGIATGLFLALILGVAVSPRYTKKVLGWIAVPIALFALGLYGYGHSHLFIEAGANTSRFVCALRAVFDASRVFVGANNWSDMKAVYQGYPFWSAAFWAIHLLAMAISAGAIIVSLGSRLLEKIRLWILFTRNVTLIYGLTENTLELGRNLKKTGRASIMSVATAEQAKLQAAAEQMGAVFRCDPDALNGTLRFLRSLGLWPKKRRLHVYALDSSMQANHQFAGKLLASLETRGVRPEQTALTILSAREETDNPMLACAGKYGYGSLLSINEPEMVARMLIRSYPPHQWMRFDKDGKALTDFHGVIIGFGQVGQAVLRQLVMNSQFCGSTSRIAIFAPDHAQQSGWLSHECREMLQHYPISLFPYDGRSRQLYDYLDEHGSSIQYVAICTGSDAINAEIGDRIQAFLMRRSYAAPVLLCSHAGVTHLSDGDQLVSHRIYTPELLCSDRMDRMAMVLNQSYCGQGDMRENWNACGYFGRMSSRASADFYGALLHCAGKTREEALQDWNPQGTLLENLAATEHLRWNAFHYCMGFRPMTDQEFRERAAEYLRAREKDPDTDYRITKDAKKRIHACMIPWEALDDYSRKENAVTGKQADYAEHDRSNGRNLAKVLLAEEA